MSLNEDDSALRQLVLLPGLDGTGKLFINFLTALPDSITATVVSYPTKKFLPYSELLLLVRAAVPKTERFVILAESFSTPLALKYAAKSPSNLAGLIMCAGFARKPIGAWSPLVKAVAMPWIFRLSPPDFALEHFLIGKNGPHALIQAIRQTLRLVSPEVLSGRVHEVLECDARDDLGGTTIPILCLRALNDKLLSASCHTEIVRIRPDIGIATVEAPHLLLQREPQKAADLVVEFMAKS